MILSKMTANVLHWIDMVAELVMAIIGRFRSVRRTQFIEEDGDVFSIHGQGADAKSEAILMSIRLLDDGALTDLKPKLAVMLRGSDVEVVLRPVIFWFALSNCLNAPGSFWTASCVRRSIG